MFLSCLYRLIGAQGILDPSVKCNFPQLYLEQGTKHIAWRKHMEVVDRKKEGESEVFVWCYEMVHFDRG